MGPYGSSLTTRLVTYHQEVNLGDAAHAAWTLTWLRLCLWAVLLGLVPWTRRSEPGVAFHPGDWLEESLDVGVRIHTTYSQEEEGLQEGEITSWLPRRH